MRQKSPALNVGLFLSFHSRGVHDIKTPHFSAPDIALCSFIACREELVDSRHGISCVVKWHSVECRVHGCNIWSTALCIHTNS